MSKELEQAQGRVNHLEKQYWKQQDRIWQLEQLCRDLWERLIGKEKMFPGYHKTAIEFFDRMDALGLLEGEQ